MELLETYRQKEIPGGERIDDTMLTQIMEEMAGAFEDDFKLRPLEIAAFDDGEHLHFVAAFSKLTSSQTAELTSEFGLMALAAVADIEGFANRDETLGEHTIIHLYSA